MRFLLITLVLCVFISCNKYENPHIISNKELLSDIRSNFKKDSLSFYQSFDKTTYNFRQSLTRIIHWNKAKQNNDTLIVPITLQLPKGQINSETGKNTLNHKVFLKVYKGNNVDYQFSMLTFIGEGTSFSKFSGVVYIEDYFKGKVQYNTYYQGIPSKTKEINYRIQTKLASVRDNKIARSLDCDWTKIGSVCVGHPTDDRAPDICSDRYEYQCNWTDEPIIIDEEQWEEDPGGGGGDSPNPPPPKNDTIPVNDPCAIAKEIEKILNNISISEKNKIIKNKELYEYGFTYQINLNNNEIKTSDIYTDYKKSSINFIWEQYNINSKILYIGGSHNHPESGGPSLTDLFTFNSYYNSLPNDIRKTFINYHSQTITTNTHTYIVTISDESKWNTEALKYQRDKTEYNNRMNTFRKEFYQTEYFKNNIYLQDLTPFQDLYALNKEAGSYINTFLIDNQNPQIKIIPYTLNSEGNFKKIECNN